MKKIIVVRHGSCDRDHLNDWGKRQMEQLAENLKECVEGARFWILSSPAYRARESAVVLAEKLCIGFEIKKELWSDCEHPEDYDAVGDLLKKVQESVDILIIVTHLEYSGGLPRYIAMHLLEVTDIGRFRTRELEKGEACLIDCETETVTLV